MGKIYFARGIQLTISIVMRLAFRLRDVWEQKRTNIDVYPYNDTFGNYKLLNLTKVGERLFYISINYGC